MHVHTPKRARLAHEKSLSWSGTFHTLFHPFTLVFQSHYLHSLSARGEVRYM